MPNRILKESICISETINDLSPELEVFFYRLIVQCDDYGRFDARPSIIRSRCYPLRLDKVTDKQVASWLNGLVAAGVVKLYTSGDKQYLLITTWDKHQQVRARRSKYPTPDSICNQLLADDSICNQLLADDSICHRNPNPNPIRESESYSLPEFINSDIWAGFLEVRKRKRTPNTNHALKLILKELETLRAAGENPDDILNQSIMRGWSGVFTLKNKNGGQTNGINRQHTKANDADRDAKLEAWNH